MPFAICLLFLGNTSKDRDFIFSISLIPKKSGCSLRGSKFPRQIRYSNGDAKYI